MKKILALFFAVLMVLSLTAVLASCGGGDKQSETKASETKSPESKTETASESQSESQSESDTPAHEHSFGDWTVVKEATCTEEGSEERVCACGEKETQKIDAKGHTFGDWVVVKEATAEEEGVKERVCSVCQEKETASIPATTHEHSFGDWTVVKEATCTEEGSEERVCACGEKETRKIDAKGHNYVDTVTPPTETEQGYTTHTCSVCGDSYKDSYTDPTGPDVDPVKGNFDTVLSHPWFDFNYSDNRTYDFTDTDGLTGYELINLEKLHLDCATPNGWTQISVFYIPQRKTINGKPSGNFTSNDYISMGAIRSVTDGTYTFGMRFNLGTSNVITMSPTAYNAKDTQMIGDRWNKADYTDQYIMVAQVFTATGSAMYINGTLRATTVPASSNYATIAQATIYHKYLVLNGDVGEGTYMDNIIDQYKNLGVKLMYSTGYAYAADEKAISTFAQYFKDGKDLPTPEKTYELSFDDSEFTPTFDPTDDRPSNYEEVLKYEYFDYNYAKDGGLKKMDVVDLKKFWNGPLVNGRCSVGLYYIPEAEYTDTDYLGLMQNKDYSPGAFGATLCYNLATDYVMNLDGSIANPLNSKAEKYHARGWVLFISSYDGEILKVWCNNTLVLQADLSSSGIVQTYILGYDLGNPDSSSDMRLREMIINGYAHDTANTSSETYIADDMYAKYGIYMLCAKFYACAPNQNAANEMYEKIMSDYAEYMK